MRLRAPAFRSIHDAAMFIRSGFTDARLQRMRLAKSTAAAFDQLYSEAFSNDPWIATSSRSRYQNRKYDAVLDMLPKGRFRRVLDVGCGIGLLTERLAGRADHVTGIDISEVALGRAAERLTEQTNVSWRHGDAANLDLAAEEPFDLIVVADTIYYFDQPISDATIKHLAWRLSQHMSDDAVLLLVNHYFFVPNADTRMTQHIHDVFACSPFLTRAEEERRIFYMATQFRRCAQP